ncbi:MAG: type II toxin-antitoxin system VapC family toxin [Proteobacteria bacterium]|nr:type II toxin-antitoxin system VapC family toxin [Pseudomonadota bacterium]
MSFVLDNSVALAWCFADEQTKPIMAILDRLIETGATVPQLWPIEALNGLLTAHRRGRIDRNLLDHLISLLKSLPITIDGDTAPRIWTETAALAAKHGLTAYDACYLELAVRLRLPLATADKALRAAATSERIILV